MAELDRDLAVLQEYRMQEEVISSICAGTLDGAVVDLQPADVAALLSLSRPSYPRMLRACEPSRSADGRDEFDFISDFMFAVLLSHYAAAEELHRALRLDWVRTWAGWREAESRLAECDDDESRNIVAAEYAQRLSRITSDNVRVVAKTDSARRRELRESGRHIGVGVVHGHNECCADSLLQLLAVRGFLPRDTAGDSRRARAIRKEACRRCRAYLVSHEDERLRPRERTHLGAIADATDAEHNRAYLQHDVHAEPVVRFFLRHFNAEGLLEPRGIRVVVYTRWDSVELQPEALAVTFGRAASADGDGVRGAYVFELFNSTGDNFVGVL